MPSVETTGGMVLALLDALHEEIQTFIDEKEQMEAFANSLRIENDLLKDKIAELMEFKEKGKVKRGQ